MMENLNFLKLHMHFAGVHLKVDYHEIFEEFFLMESIIFSGKKRKNSTILDHLWDLYRLCLRYDKIKY